MYIIPEKSSSCQLVADFKAKKRRNTSKTTQKCQNCLKIQGKICSEILVAVVSIISRYDIYIYVYIYIYIYIFR